MLDPEATTLQKGEFNFVAAWLKKNAHFYDRQAQYLAELFGDQFSGRRFIVDYNPQEPVKAYTHLIPGDPVNLFTLTEIFNVRGEVVAMELYQGGQREASKYLAGIAQAWPFVTVSSKQAEQIIRNSALSVLRF